MRLLSTHDLHFHEFYDSEIPSYTILSHTWGSEEVTFKEMKKRSSELEQKAGYQKIVACARESKRRGYDWTWIDTCCIDKRSSAELSEAINTMYIWYTKSAECLVYLSDFEGTGYPGVEDWSEQTLLAFRRCRWFTRGWTLQELIAPSFLWFFDADWRLLGSHYNSKMMSYISEITAIPFALLGLPRTRDLTRYSAAQKMSWAGRRQTTRREDTAYSLLGLFNVNMPLLYGEGEKAFLRLQEEIMKRSGDRSIFMWMDPSGDEYSYRGLLATSPAEFIDCGSVENVKLDPAQRSKLLPFAMTNEGLQLQMHIIPLTRDDMIHLGISSTPYEPTELYLLNLWGVAQGNYILSIVLKRLAPGGVQFARVMTGTMIGIEPHKLSSLSSTLESFFVRQPVQFIEEDSSPLIYGFLVESDSENIFDQEGRKLTESVLRAEAFPDGSFVGAFSWSPNSFIDTTSYWVTIGSFPGEEGRFRSTVVVKSRKRFGKGLSPPINNYLATKCKSHHLEPLTLKNIKVQNDRTKCDGLRW